MHTWVYIDGFNLYYAIRESGCKWLNVKTLVEVAMPAGTALIDKVKYYAVVISNDTDLVEPIRIVVRELGKPVTLLCPSSFEASKPLVEVASSVRHIHLAHLKAAVFPNLIPSTEIVKPSTW